MLIPWINQVSPAERKQILFALSTLSLINGRGCPCGSTPSWSIRSLVMRHANDVSCLNAARIWRQILSAGGAQMPRVYLSLVILPTDSRSW